MATATMATAAGAAALLYYTLNRKLQSNGSHGDDNDDDGDENGSDATTDIPLGIDRVSHRLIQAPATWLETISTLSETLRFTYSETLGKWPIGDLAFGISFLLKRQVTVLKCDILAKVCSMYFCTSLKEFVVVIIIIIVWFTRPPNEFMHGRDLTRIFLLMLLVIRPTSDCFIVLCRETYMLQVYLVVKTVYCSKEQI